MKLLITGATGLVGKEIVAKAHQLGHEVHFLTTRPTEVNRFAPAKGFLWNPSKNQIDENCLIGVDVIFHLAGATVSKRWSKSYKTTIRKSRVESTRLLFKTLKEKANNHQVSQVVSASAIGVYPHEPEQWVDEETPINPTAFMQSVVWEWENEVDQITTLSIRVVKLRIGLVLSRNGGVVKTLKIPALMGLATAFGSGTQGQSWIHIDDLVALFFEAATHHWEGIFNSVSPYPVMQNEFVKSLAKSLKRPVVFPPIPKFLIKLMVGEMSDLVLDSHWVSSKKIEQKGFVFKFPDIMSAFNALFLPSKA